MAFESISNGVQAQITKVPSGEDSAGKDYIFVQGLESRVLADDLLALAMFLLLNSSLKEGGLLVDFVENVRRLRIVVDEGGNRRFELPI